MPTVSDSSRSAVCADSLLRQVQSGGATLETTINLLTWRVSRAGCCEMSDLRANRDQRIPVAIPIVCHWRTIGRLLCNLIAIHNRDNSTSQLRRQQDGWPPLMQLFPPELGLTCVLQNKTRNNNKSIGRTSQFAQCGYCSPAEQYRLAERGCFLATARADLFVQDRVRARNLVRAEFTNQPKLMANSETLRTKTIDTSPVGEPTFTS